MYELCETYTFHQLNTDTSSVSDCLLAKTIPLENHSFIY